MKLQRLMAEVKEKLTELNTEMDRLGFGWIVCDRSIEKAFGDIDCEVERRHRTKKSSGQDIRCECPEDEVDLVPEHNICIACEKPRR